MKAEKKNKPLMIVFLTMLTVLALIFIMLKNTSDQELRADYASTTLKIAVVELLLATDEVKMENPIIFDQLSESVKNKILDSLSKSFRSIYISKKFTFGEEPEIVFLSVDMYCNGEDSMSSATPNAFLVGLSDGRPIFIKKEDLKMVNIGNFKKYDLTARKSSN